MRTAILALTLLILASLGLAGFPMVFTLFAVAVVVAASIYLMRRLG